jgi:hypothetical protein
METLHSEGLGHTCGIWASAPEVLEAWFLEKPANRILANGPCSQGAVGYSTWLVPSMSLGCGPQAGNITSDNISARHLVNIKRVALPRRDWEEIQRRDHERAARLGGEAAPRGTFLPGDPALGAGRAGPAGASTLAASNALASNWQGNAPLGGEGAATRAKVNPAPKATAAATSAPRFTGGGTPNTAAPAPAPAPAARPSARSAPAAPATAPAAPYVGTELSAAEIESIMSHAGAGCPLGPCEGCPHLNVANGTCTA